MFGAVINFDKHSINHNAFIKIHNRAKHTSKLIHNAPNSSSRPLVSMLVVKTFTFTPSTPVRTHDTQKYKNQANRKITYQPSNADIIANQSNINIALYQNMLTGFTCCCQLVQLESGCEVIIFFLPFTFTQIGRQKHHQHNVLGL